MAQPPTRASLDEAERGEPATRPFVMPPLETLRKRAEFLACARARKAHTHGMVVQGRRRPGDAAGVRVGFTASRKVGKAVERNRARRRLRAAARLVLPGGGREGWDYVLVARSGTTVARPFSRLVGDLERALRRLHGDRTDEMAE